MKGGSLWLVWGGLSSGEAGLELQSLADTVQHLSGFINCREGEEIITLVNDSRTFSNL